MRGAGTINLGAFFDHRARGPAIGNGAGGGCRWEHRRGRHAGPPQGGQKGLIGRADLLFVERVIARMGLPE